MSKHLDKGVFGSRSSESCIKGPSRERVSNPSSIPHELKKIIAAIVPVFFRTITSLLLEQLRSSYPPLHFYYLVCQSFIQPPTTITCQNAPSPAPSDLPATTPLHPVGWSMLRRSSWHLQRYKSFFSMHSRPVRLFVSPHLPQSQRSAGFLLDGIGRLHESRRYDYRTLRNVAPEISHGRLKRRWPH